MARKKKKVTKKASTKSKAKSKVKASSKGKKTTAKKNRGAAAKKASVVVKKTARASAVEIQPVDKVAKNVKKARTKSDIMGILAESSGLSKKEIVAVFENLQELINLDLGKKGPGVFNLPGLMKIVRVNKPATKARKGINPFTKEPMTFKAKPARSVVKVRPLKGLKEMVQ